MPTYVYGVAAAPPTISAAGVGGDAAGAVEALEHDGLAAVVSDLPDEPIMPTRRNLLAHTRVLEEAISQGPMLPARFGTVLPDRDAVVGVVLAQRGADLQAGLARVRGAVEVVVKGSYVEDALLADIVRKDRTVARLRERSRRSSGAGDYQQRLRLGELVAGLVQRRREQDGQRIVARLEPLAREVAVREAVQRLDIANLSFLVDRDGLAPFVEAVAALDEELGNVGRLRHVGPLAPHSFVDLSW
jgi:hypothetical protein